MLLKVLAAKDIKLLSKPQSTTQKTYYQKNKIKLNSARGNLTQIRESIILWDIPLKYLTVVNQKASQMQHLEAMVKDFLFKKRLEINPSLAQALKYLDKSSISRFFSHKFSNKNQLDSNQAQELIAKTKEQISRDLELYLSFFSQSDTKVEQQKIPKYLEFLDLEELIAENYGVSALNFINHHYSLYPNYYAI